MGLLGNLSCANALALISAGAVKLAIAAASPCKVCRRFALCVFLSILVSVIFYVLTTTRQPPLISKCCNTRLRTAQDECMDIVGALISVDYFQVDQMAGYTKLVADTVTAHHVARHACNV